MSPRLSKLFWSMKSSHLGTLVQGFFPRPGDIWSLEDCVRACVILLNFKVVSVSPPHLPLTLITAALVWPCVYLQNCGPARALLCITLSHWELLWLKSLLPPHPWRVSRRTCSQFPILPPLIQPCRGPVLRDRVGISGLIPLLKMEEAGEDMVVLGAVLLSGKSKLFSTLRVLSADLVNLLNVVIK